jgi:hypothetical protein
MHLIVDSIFAIIKFQYLFLIGSYLQFHFNKKMIDKKCIAKKISFCFHLSK